MIERFLVVGFGSIGRRHVEILRRRYPQATITLLRHRVHSAGQPTEPVSSAVSEIVYSLEDALARKPQAAILANPATCHLSLAMYLARAGVHLFIEKPLSTDTSGVSELLALCAGDRLILQIGYNLRFSPSLGAFRTALQEGIIGEFLSVRAEVGQYLPSWRPGRDYRHTVSARKDLGGGVLLELSHEIDYMQWLFGPVTEVSARLAKNSRLEIDVEDTVHAWFSFAKNADDRCLTASLDVDFIRQDNTRRCLVIGERGTLRWDGIARKVEVFLAGETGWREVFVDCRDACHPYLLEMEFFVDAIEKGALLAPAANGHDGYAVMRVVEACRESQIRRRTVLVGDGVVGE